MWVTQNGLHIYICPHDKIITFHLLFPRWLTGWYTLTKYMSVLYWTFLRLHAHCSFSVSWRLFSTLRRQRFNPLFNAYFLKWVYISFYKTQLSHHGYFIFASGLFFPLRSSYSIFTMAHNVYNMGTVSPQSTCTWVIITITPRNEHGGHVVSYSACDSLHIFLCSQIHIQKWWAPRMKVRLDDLTFRSRIAINPQQYHLHQLKIVM